MHDSLTFTGHVLLELHDAQGVLRERREFHNLVVTAGKAFVASRMASASAAVMGWIAVGTGTNAAVVGDTALQTEVARQAVSVSGGTPSGSSLAFAATLAAGTGTGALTEAGILNASSTGTLLARTVFAVLNKLAGDTLTINWTLTVG